MNNSTSDCYIGPDSLHLREITFFISYYILGPIYIVMGLFGNTVLLIAFHKESKIETGYVYQIMVTVSKTLELLAFAVSVASKKWWSGLESAGADWFKRLFFPMWYTAHVSGALVNGFTTSYLLLSVTMAADRVFAIGVPFKYRNLNHRLHQINSAVFCFFWGLITSLFDCFRYVVVQNGQAYKVIVDKEYVGSTLADGLSNLRNTIRIGGLIALIGLNIAMTILFKKRTTKVSQMMNNRKDQQSKGGADKILLLLTIWQSSLICVAMGPLISYYILVYVAPSFSTCWGTVMIPFVDGSVVTAYTIDFFVVLVVNKKLRKMVMDVIRCRSTEVATSSQGRQSLRAVVAT